VPRARSEGSAEKSATDSFPTLSPDHSPASLGTSPNSQNVNTPSSQDNPSGANSSYSPPPNYFNEFSGMTVDGTDNYDGSMSKDIMNWDMLGDFNGVNLEQDVAGMGGLNMGITNPELSDLFIERTS
jgi:hypothetical protein